MKTIYESDTHELVRVDRYRNLDEKLVTHSKEILLQEAAFAFKLIERWGLIVGTAEGEDSAGRQAYRLATPDEVVERAFDTAIKAHEVARKRGLVVKLPKYAELFGEDD